MYIKLDMTALLVILFGILGLLVGSFLNVLVLRMRTGLSPAKGRSMCFSCGKTLGAIELIPVVSYVIQRGRCVSCEAKISAQYPLVESATAVLFGVVGYMMFVQYGVSVQFFVEALFGLILVSLFVAISVYDIKHKIIPDGFVISLVVLGLIKLVLDVLLLQGLWSTIGWRILSAVILFLPFFLLWLVSKGRWIGLGDGKLVFAFGILLPVASALSGIVLAFWVGALFGVVLIGMSRVLRHTYAMKSEVPFAPFLILGALVVYFFPLDLFNVVLIHEYVSLFI